MSRPRATDEERINAYGMMIRHLMRKLELKEVSLTLTDEDMIPFRLAWNANGDQLTFQLLEGKEFLQ